MLTGSNSCLVINPERAHGSVAILPGADLEHGLISMALRISQFLHISLESLVPNAPHLLQAVKTIQ